MDEGEGEGRQGREGPVGTPLELERGRLHLRVLLETSRELSGMLQPRAILETFLLTAMGPLGITRGVCILAKPSAPLGSGGGVIVSRGLPKADAQGLEARLQDICDAYFPYRDAEADFPAAKVRLLPRPQVPDDGLLPGGMETLLIWSVDEEHCGLLALGPRLDRQGEELDQDSAGLLQNLVHILIGALRGALAVNSIRQMTTDLSRKNERLGEALASSQAAQRGLDRRVHQLAAINELSGELSRTRDLKEILDRFLLTMLGAFSASAGLALVLDRATGQSTAALRGAAYSAGNGSGGPGGPGGGHGSGLEGLLSVNDLVYKAFTATSARSVAPLTVDFVHDPARALAGCGLAFTPSEALFFALDEQVQGVFVLGPWLDATSAGDEEEPPPRPGAGQSAAASVAAAMGEVERQLLRAQVGSLLGYVQGARHLATITGLNEDLTRRNEELTRTITELTEARQTIALLERAGERVRSFLKSEAQRSRRFSWLDCGVILAAATLLALLFNLASPNGVPLVPEHLRRPPAPSVTAQKARELVDSEGALIVDARPQAFFDQKRIRGAVNLPPTLFDMVYLMRFSTMPLETPIIVYGGNLSRRWDEEVAARLGAREHERVLVLEDGLDAWMGRGYPVEP